MITPHASARQSSHLADACYHGLRLAGWLAVTLGCVAALWLLFFAALGNFSFGGTVRQIENFARAMSPRAPSARTTSRASSG